MASIKVFNFACFYWFKFNDENIRTGEICSELTIKTPEQCRWHYFVVFIGYFEHVSQIVL